MQPLSRGALALICAPFAALVLASALINLLPFVGCDPYHREVVLTADGAWRDPPELWRGRLPAPEELDPVFFESRARATTWGVPMTGETVGAWRYLHWVLLAAILALYTRGSLFAPNEFGDHFLEIVTAYQRPLLETWATHVDQQVFFRPLEALWRKLVFWLFGERPFAHNLFQILLVALIGATMALAFRARDLRHAVAGAFALVCLFGYHGFHAVLEMNLTISNLIVVAALCLTVLMLASRPRPWSNAAIVALSLLTVLTKEVGIIVPFVSVLAHLAGFAIPSQRTAALVGLIFLGFVGFRVAVVFGAGEVLDPSHGREARDLGAFALNVLASFLSILTATPRGGDFAALTGGIYLPPWRIFQVLTALLAFLLVGFTAVSGRVWWHDGDAELRRWVVLLAGVVAVSSGLGFFYPVDRQSAIVAPLLAFCVYLAAGRALGGLEGGSGLTIGRRPLVALLFALACVSSLRTVGGYYFMLGNARLIQDNWVLEMADYQARYADDPRGRGRYLEQLRSAALGMPRPIRSSVERELFGGANSVAR